MMRDFSSELHFKTARSSGKGGQNVNKVETKVELYFDIPNSFLLSQEEKTILLEKLASRTSNEGILRMSAQTKRSQLGNKKELLQKFQELITRSLAKPKPRKKTKPGKQVKEQRLKEKRSRSEKKAGRSKRINRFQNED